MFGGRLETLIRYVSYAARSLARTPRFTITVVLTLALGIGANTAVFSAVDAVLLQALPLPNADRLVRVMQTQQGGGETLVAPVRLEDWNRGNSTFEAMTGYYTEDVADVTLDLPESVRWAAAAPGFLQVWGIAPAIGRDFTPSDYDQLPSVVLVSDRYWRNRLGSNPNALNQTVRIGDRSFSVVGVLPPAFTLPEPEVDLWFPDFAKYAFAQRRDNRVYTGIGRLRSGVSVEEARSDLNRLQANLAAEFPDSDRDVGVRIEPLKETVVGGFGPSLWLLFGAVSVLLLITCTNIAALLLTRAAQRAQQIAVRLSLGASHASVVAQILAETVLLAIAGAVIGLWVAIGASQAFRFLVPNMPRLDEVEIDGSIMLYIASVALFVALLCGLFPAIRSARTSASLTRSARTQVSGSHSLQWLLVSVQVALSVTLLVAGGLLLRSFNALSRVDGGFDPSGVLAFRATASNREAMTYDAVVQRINVTLDELESLPGVEAAATAVLLPGIPGQRQREFGVAEGRPESEPPIVAEERYVAPGYFETMSIPLLAGEPCRRPVDNAARRKTIETMVNRSFAERYFPGRSPIGQHLTGRTFFESGRIVGVVGDARELGMDRPPVPAVYPCDPATNPFVWFLVRTTRDTSATIAAIRQKLYEIEPLRSVYDLVPLEEQIGEAYAETRLRTVVVVPFAVTALALACLGVYGTLAYVASLRQREVGLRVALGATQRNIVWYFMSRAARVVAAASLAGLLLSFAFARTLAAMLYGISPSDPLTLGGVVVIVVIAISVAAFGALLPALRGALVQPMDVLREE